MLYKRLARPRYANPGQSRTARLVTYDQYKNRLVAGGLNLTVNTTGAEQLTTTALRDLGDGSYEFEFSSNTSAGYAFILGEEGAQQGFVRAVPPSLVA